MNANVADINAARMSLFRKEMKRAGHEAFLTTSPVDIRRLCGFNGTYGLLLTTRHRNFLLTDQRYTLKASRTATGVEVVQVNGADAMKRVRGLLETTGARSVAFEPAAVTHEQYLAMKKKLRGVALTPGGGITAKLRMTKDPVEIEAVRRACRVTDLGFRRVLEAVRPGMTERELRVRLEMILLAHGIDGFAFETIVAGGPNAAQPHAEAGNRKIRSGEFVLMDFGVCLGGYNSDVTRTIFLGQPTTEQRRIYNAVLEAQLAGAAAAVPGAPIKKADAAAREVLKKHGLERYFTHSLGHGVGLEIHEEPRVAAVADGKFKEGMIVTMEPGVYIEGRLGIRIEDTGVITDKGFERLTKSDKKLICI